MMMAAVVTASATIVATSAAFAQAPAYIRATPDAAAKAFGQATSGRIFSDAWTPMRLGLVKRSQQAIPGFECPAEPQVALAQVIPFPIKPGAISWIERFVLGCKPATIRNFLMILDGEQPRAIELLPGQTNADPQLQRDALLGAAGFAGTVGAKDCKQRVVVDTRITTPPSPTGWVERWTHDVCGTRAEVEVIFTPSSRGGTDWRARLVK